MNKIEFTAPVYINSDNGTSFYLFRNNKVVTQIFVSDRDCIIYRSNMLDVMHKLVEDFINESEPDLKNYSIKIG